MPMEKHSDSPFKNAGLTVAPATYVCLHAHKEYVVFVPQPIYVSGTHANF